MLWVLLSLLTGSPLSALVLAVALVWVADRYALRLLPRPLRALARWRRERLLRRTLAVNPHDRRARLELADLLLARRPAEAAALARANVEAGDEDVYTLYVLGAGLARSGHDEAAERVLDAARAIEPGFRMGEIDLELGTARLRGGDLAGARDALLRFVQERPGTVQGRYLLAQALRRAGDGGGAARVRDEAWSEYRLLPRFRRREERRWAWSLRPLRGLAGIAGIAAACAGGGALLALLLGGVVHGDGIMKTLLGGVSGGGMDAEDRLVVFWNGYRRGDVTWLVALDWPKTSTQQERHADTRLDVVRERVRIGGEEVPLLTGVPRAYVFEGDRVVAEIPIAMTEDDLSGLARLTRYQDVIPYLRRFEAPATPRPVRRSARDSAATLGSARASVGDAVIEQ